MLVSYLVDTGLLSPNELDAAQTLARSARARGTPLSVLDALVQLGLLSASALMAITFLYQLDRTASAQTAATLEAYLLSCGALMASELAQARAAQAHALAGGAVLSLGAALVRAGNLSRQVLDQRLAQPITPRPLPK